MSDPLFWLALSFLLVVISLTAVLMVAIPAMRELGRAARSAEKFFDTLGRELPPTLEAIRLTGLEITELTDDVTEGVQSAGQVVHQVNQSISTAQTGAKRLNTGTKSLLTGARAAWRAWTNDSPPPRSHNELNRRPSPSTPPSEPPEQRRPRADEPLARLNPGAAEGDGQIGDRALPGSSPAPQPSETSLKAAPEALPEPIPRAEIREAPPRRSP